MVMEGVILVKFWIQVSPEEQLRRFESRQNDKLRSWKLTEEDWRNRDKADQYDEAVEEMFLRTDHDLARWNLVSGENKKWARVDHPRDALRPRRRRPRTLARLTPVSLDARSRVSDNVDRTDLRSHRTAELAMCVSDDAQIADAPLHTNPVTRGDVSRSVSQPMRSAIAWAGSPLVTRVSPTSTAS